MSRLLALHALVARRRLSLLILVFQLSCLVWPMLVCADETEFYDNGVALMGQQKYAEAETEFRKAIQTDPRYKEAWQALTDVLKAEGKAEQAAAAQKMADAAPAARAGVAPPLTEEQKRALGAVPTGSGQTATARDTTAPTVAKPPPVTRPAPRQTAPPAAPARAIKLPPLAPKPGYIVGRAVNQGGSPLPVFTVEYSGFQTGKLASYNPNGAAIETVTGKVQGHNGHYEIKVPDGAYRELVYVTYAYKGRTYNFDLEPRNPPARHDYEGLGLDKLRGGLVRDFILKMTEKKAGASEDTETVYKYAYYGGRVDLECRQVEGILGGGHPFTTALRDAYPKESRVEVTLTPTGPLVDGSTANPVTASLHLGDDGQYTFCVRGVYPGTYAATARLTTPTGEAVPLRLSLKPGRTVLKGAGEYDKVVVDWQPSVTVDFLPNDLGPVPRFGVKDATLYLGK